MTDVIKNAMNYRSRLKAELNKVDEFLRLAEEFSKDSGELRLTTAKPAEPAPQPTPQSTSQPASEAAKPQTPFERMRAAANGANS